MNGEDVIATINNRVYSRHRKNCQSTDLGKLSPCSVTLAILLLRQLAIHVVGELHN